MGGAAQRDAHLPPEHFMYAYNASKRTKCRIKHRKRREGRPCHTPQPARIDQHCWDCAPV